MATFEEYAEQPNGKTIKIDIDSSNVRQQKIVGVIVTGLISTFAASPLTKLVSGISCAFLGASLANDYLNDNGAEEEA